jgi:hypothetical protein
VFFCKSLLCLYYLSTLVCPLRFSGRPIRERARAQASLLSLTTINTALPPSAPPSSLCVLFQLSVARSRFLAQPNLCATRSFPPRALRLSFEPFGLAVAERREGPAGLKPESSISHSRVDAIECLRRRSFPLS